MMKLKQTDVANLDFNVPIRLQQIKVGSIILSDGCYYLNLISDYQPGLPCQVTLIAF